MTIETEAEKPKAKPARSRGPKTTPPAPAVVQAPEFVPVSIDPTAADAFAEVGRLTLLVGKALRANSDLGGEVGRLRALLEKHGLDPNEQL